jgi:hypothetical protein
MSKRKLPYNILSAKSREAMVQVFRDWAVYGEGYAKLNADGDLIHLPFKKVKGLK